MAEANTTQGQTGSQARHSKLDRRADVWEHFPSVDDVMAKCKHCGKLMKQTKGTSSIRKHLVNHFTTRQVDKNKGIARCKICQREFAAASDPTLWNHVKGCIEQEAAATVGVSSRPPVQTSHAPSGSGAAVGASEPPPPPVQSRAPSAPGEEQDAAAAVGAASEPPVQVQSRAPLGSGESSMDTEPAGLDQAEASRDLARMIALGGHDPSVVEDNYFKNFVRRLNPGYEVPSRRAIEEMCDVICDESKEDFLSRLRDKDAQFSISVGTAKTIEEGQVLYLACHFIDKQWNLHRMVMEAQVEATLKFCRSQGSSTALFQMGSDEATQLECFFQDKFHSVEDVAHGRAFMTACGIPRLHNLDLLADGDNYIDSTTCTDVVFHSIAQCFSSYLDSEEMSAGFYIYDDVSSLHLTRQKREKLLSDHGHKHAWAHNEQWYSWYCLLQVLHSESPEIDSEMRQVMLKIWGEIYRAIQSISAPRSPTSNLYLIELFKVREVLHSDAVAEAAEVTELADCLTKAKETLDNAIKDSYQLWSIPLVLDPRYKLKKIKSLFKKSFGSDAGKYISKVAKDIELMYKDFRCLGEPFDNGEEMDIDDSQEATTQLDRYLEDSLASRKEGFDVLNWWNEFGSDLYPTVARMARGALAAPTCTKLSSEQTAQLSSIVRGYSRNRKTKNPNDMQIGQVKGHYWWEIA